jgi:hypothetical protein
MNREGEGRGKEEEEAVTRAIQTNSSRRGQTSGTAFFFR